MNRTKHADELLDARSDRLDGADEFVSDDEPLYSTRRSVFSSGGSLVIAIPATGRNIHGVTDDDDALVEVYRNGIFVQFGGSDETDK